MRAIALCMAILLLLVSSSSAIAEIRDPGNVNKLLMYGTFETPNLEPGGEGILAFNFTNPYNMSMIDVALNVSIYQYVEQEVSMAVDSSWGWEYPRFAEATGTGRETIFNYASLDVNESQRIILTVQTSVDMPHGGIFSQGAYLIRFWLTFTLNSTPAKMASPGYWSKEQFQNATAEGEDCTSSSCIGQVNLSRLGNIDGILPDTAFGVKDTIPVWPFYAMAVGAVFFLVLAFLYYAEENPSSFPRTARMFAYFKGRLVQVFRPRKRKKIE